jgi:dipeptidyl aminopeptidase/acylaminoacyl peptidase
VDIFSRMLKLHENLNQPLFTKMRIKICVKITIGLIFLCSVVIIFGQKNITQSTHWTPQRQMQVKTLGGLSVSSDGKKVAFTVIDAVMTAERSEMVAQIYLVNADGSDTRQITFSEKSSFNPKFSPDGRFLALLSNRKDGRTNVFLIRVDGGEAVQLTESKTSVTNFQWSPDSASIAFTAMDAKTADEEKNERGRSDFRWIDEEEKMQHLYLLKVENVQLPTKPEAIKLTSGKFSVGTDFNWSPEGDKIAFSHQRSVNADDWKTSDVSVIETRTLKITQVASTSAAESAPYFSPDGKQIALIVEDNPPHWAGGQRIQITPVPNINGTARKLAPTFNNQPTLLGWSKDGRRIYFSEAKRTAISIYSVETGSSRISEISKNSDEVYQNVTLNNSGKILGFILQKSDRPAEVYIGNIENFSLVQVSRVNDDVSNFPVGKTEVITWKSKDGIEVEGLLTYPVDYQAGKKVPLILNIHGGPAGVFQQTYIGARGVYPLAAWGERGFAVLRANPRGSNGYGSDFRRANLNDWGFGDYEDLMKGVDKVIEMGIADPDKLGVSGWSYGGFMTSWIITQTQRFKAASAGAPVTNLVSFQGTTDIATYLPDYFGGLPWEFSGIYQKHSPIFNIRNASTPTLIQHGESDIRVPISQGYELYNALKSKGVPVRMLVLPRQGHSPTEPKMFVEILKSNINWFEKYLG